MSTTSKKSPDDDRGPVRRDSALRSPIEELPVRGPRTDRRTTSVDIVPGPSGNPLDGYRLVGCAVDHTREGTDHRATLEAHLDGASRLIAIDTDPPAVDCERLVGLTVRQGFRAAIRDVVTSNSARDLLLSSLLDELPVAALISGYGLLYTGRIPVAAPNDQLKSDICSGWRADGTMMTSVRIGRGVPTPLGPTAPPLDAEFPGLAALPPFGMRRQRLIDSTPTDEGVEVYAWFRDIFVDAEGDSTVLHEYDLRALVVNGVFTRVAAVPRVLPYVECPVAAASADSLVGLTPASVRDHVRETLNGTRTCTHLNDLLRSLADVRC